LQWRIPFTEEFLDREDAILERHAELWISLCRWNTTFLDRCFRRKYKSRRKANPTEIGIMNLFSVWWQDHAAIILQLCGRNSWGKAA
jgi:hypothetical protein